MPVANLEGTRLLVAGVEALLTYVSSTQINALVPYAISGISKADMQVEYQGLKSNRISVTVEPTHPGVFTTNAAGTGQAVAVNQDGSLNTETNRAARGSIISFWATGQGRTTPALADGVRPQGPLFPTPISPVSVLIGGVAVTPEFVGLIYAGVLQVNVRVPQNITADSRTELLIRVGTATSREGHFTLPAVTVGIL